jgi:pSer/pThr/pTyr-binding forkhead associated (FHA) protein
MEEDETQRRRRDGNNGNEDGSGTGELPVSIPSSVYLVIDGRKAIALDQPVISIGRSHENTVVLDDPRVSRKHIEIRVIRDHFVIFDLGSSGGTYVNGQRVSQGMLYPGDLISLAGVNMVFTRDTRFLHQSDSSGNSMGPGQRPTAVFDQTLYERKKKSN